MEIRAGLTGPIGASTVLDGFTISEGQGPGNGAGLYCYGEGAGNECSPTLANLIFENNKGTCGGAMCTDGSASGISSPHLANVTFASNYASQGGGGMCNQGSATSVPVLTGVTFSGNTTDNGDGGAMYAVAGSSPVLNNVTFSGNGGTSNLGPFQTSLGGAVYLNQGGTLTLNNVTFSGNSATGDGGAMYVTGGSSAVISNAILWGDSVGAGGTESEILNNGGTVTLTSSVIQGGCPTGSTCIGVINSDPLLGALQDNGGATRTMLLMPGSSAIDTGYDPSCATTDQRGVPRPQGSTCDIGAVEDVIPCHVKAGASGGNTGETWNDAFPNLESALFQKVYPCVEIWVAEGTYTPGPDDTTFHVRPGVAVYGGFKGTELQRDPPDVRTGRTVLSGNGSHHVVIIDGTTAFGNVGPDTMVERFVITGGADDIGGGMYCNGSHGHTCNPTLNYLQIIGNSASNAGGALYNDGSVGGDSSPTITNSTFAYNSTLGGTLGGAILNNGENGGKSSPVLMNVTFVGNHAGSFGGGVADYAPNNGTSNPTLTNVSFSGNSAVAGAGAMTSIGDLAGCSSVLMPLLTNVIAWADASPTREIQDGACGETTFKNSLIEGSGGSAAWNADFGIDGGGNLDADPLLGALQYNGGPTQTKMIGAGSPAIDGGTNAGCPNNDQRALARPVGAHCDIGAVERQATEDHIFNTRFDLF